MTEESGPENRHDEQQHILHIEAEKALAWLQPEYCRGDSGHQQSVYGQTDHPRNIVPIGRHHRDYAETDGEGTETDQRPETDGSRPFGFILPDALRGFRVDKARIQPFVQFSLRQSPIPVAVKKLRETCRYGKFGTDKSNPFAGSIVDLGGMDVDPVFQRSVHRTFFRDFE